jgi:hypothetical protein
VKRAAALAAALLSIGLVLGGPASAHQTAPGISNVLDGITPAAPDVIVQVVTSVVDQLVVENKGAAPLLVLDDAGRPFLRIGPAGEGVSGDFSSLAWYSDNDPSGAALPPPDAKGAPQWVKVTSESSWGWFDHRLHAGSPTDLGSWRVPVRYGNVDAAIVGHREFHRPTGRIAARLTSSAHPLPGLTAVVLPGQVPGLFVSSSSTAAVTVNGAGGEPFARLSSGGVEVNTASPTWSLTAASRGTSPDGEVDPAAPPRWRQIDTAPRLSWLESRALYPASHPPAAIEQRKRTVTLVRWRVPLESNGRHADLEGVTEWIPLAGGAAKNSGHGPVIRIVLAAVIGAAVASGLSLNLRRRRRRDTLTV